ncbi:hypothetical protein LTR27_010382 [Elasticomyces elasticus]|nr:hypothetical protein LTR27_010382 [Elasticomyces elasticus]
MAVQTRSQSAGKGKAKPKRATKTKKAQPNKSASVAKPKKAGGYGAIPTNSEIQQLRIDFHQKYVAILHESQAKAAKNPEDRPKLNKQYKKDIDAMKVRHRKALAAYRARDHAARSDYEIVDERPVTSPMLHG